MTKILLVDDEPIVLRVMRLALEKAGFEVDVAINGEEALERIATNCPDAMVTDIEMPRMSGKELCVRIQQMMPDRKFPIFVSTSLTELEHREWAGKISGLLFLEKPISVRKLQYEISKHIDSGDSVNLVGLS